MKKRLAIGIVLGAMGEANAAVITYEASGWANVSYAQRYVIGDPFSVSDVKDAYGPRQIGGPRFTIDTSVFQGMSFAYSSTLADSRVPLPPGLEGLGTESFYEYSVQFDQAWNVVDLRAWFESGSAGESWYVTLDGAYLRNDQGVRRSFIHPSTGLEVPSVDFYGYYAPEVRVSQTFAANPADPSPVPLPASVQLLLSGVAGIWLLRRGKRAAQAPIK